MIFTETAVRGAYILAPERKHDDRGYFARTWCRREFQDHGLNADLAQISVSYNHRAGTLRGLHYQAAPHQEAKLVRCTRGAIFDVVVDLRPHSPTYLAHATADLDPDNGLMLYIPEGCAHGFQTRADASEVLYHISTFYHPDAARGVRWNDPTLGIKWPGEPAVISAQDTSYSNWQP